MIEYIHPNVDRHDPMTADLIRACEADDRDIPWRVLPCTPVPHASWWRRLLERLGWHA